MHSISHTRNLVLCAMCAAVMCLAAPLSIPLSAGVPLSLATFICMLSGALLGEIYGAVSQLIYILIGAIGLPVFSGFKGGLGVVTGMTGGYIIGYIVLAFCTGFFFKRLGRGKNHPVRIALLVAGMAAGTVLLYAAGTAWFMFCTGMTLSASLAACVLPFIPGDLAKMIGVVMIAPPIEAAVRRAYPSGLMFL